MRHDKPRVCHLDRAAAARLNAVWSLTEGGGTRCVNAARPGQYDGTLGTGTLEPQWSAQGLRFDGSDYFAPGEAVYSAGSGTVGCWVQMSSIPGANSFFFAQQPSTNERIYAWATSSGVLNFAHANQNNQSSGKTLSANVLYHVAIAWLGTAWAGYLDGVEVISNTSAGLSAVAAVNFGRYSGGGQGMIGEMLLAYSSPHRLTAAEIRRLNGLGMRLIRADVRMPWLGAGEAGEPPAEPTNELMMLVA